ncbi:MAG: DUF2961 domain-containing protein [Bacteroidales bacterium]|nr:DUF2961 domain-containing protein [Bacteroidales bacterium]
MKRLFLLKMKLALCHILFAGMLLSCAEHGNVTVAEDFSGSLEAELKCLYRLDFLPQYRQGVVEQVSSYDTTGMNDDGLSGKYSYIRKEGRKLVLADLKGPGVIQRIWTPTPSNDTIQFYFDGEATPRISIPFIDLFSGKVFPFVHPVCGSEVGGYYCYTPIRYGKSCKIMYTGERIYYHQIQWRPYPENASVESFTMDWSAAEKEQLHAACRFWNGETTPLEQWKQAGWDVKEEVRQFSVSPGEDIPFFTSRKGGRIVGIRMECGNALEGQNMDLVLSAQWDNDPLPAIYAPAADFFGYAFGKPSMRSLLAGSSNGVNYCYIPMPFGKKAELKIVYEKRRDAGQPRIELTTRVYYLEQPQDAETEGRLYAVRRRERPEDGKPYLFAELNDRGHYIGTIHLAQGLQPGETLFFEGDEVVTVDGKMRIHGTGSEDAYNGGWYSVPDRWDRGVSLPIHGSLDYSLPMCRTGAYRFFLTDKLSFSENLLFTIEHGPENNLFPVDYTSVAFYYGSKPVAEAKPDETLRTVYYPEEHVFSPQLMELLIDRNTTVENRRRLIVWSVLGSGMVRILLNDIPEGKYTLFLTYFQTPDGGAFSVWNRHKMIADWKEVHADRETLMERQELGTVNITRQTNSISIRVRKTDRGNKFHFGNLYLKKIKN